MFIGLIIPHLVRRFIGSSHLPLFFWSGINGASLLLTADLFGRLLRPPAEIHAGVLVGLLGAPCFIYILAKKRRGVLT